MNLREFDADKVPYYDDRFHAVAARAIMTCMPELRDLLNQTVTVDALQAVAIEEDETQAFDEIHVGGGISYGSYSANYRRYDR